MRSDRNWPARRTQLLVIVFLAAAALLQVFVPPISRKDRAERLYEDAWFGATAVSFAAMLGSDESGSGSPSSVKKLEAALRHYPGHPLYEQALVWHYDRAKLPDLLARRELGPEARLLARWLVLDRKTEKWKGKHPISSVPSAPATDPATEQLLAQIDEMAELDASNALPLYDKAMVLSRANRPDEAHAALAKAARVGKITFPQPEVSDAVRDTAADPGILGAYFARSSEYRQIARSIAEEGNRRLRQGQVAEARGLLETGCQVSIDIALSEPRQIISVLVGSAVFSIDGRHLEPIYKDFGMKAKVAEFQKADRAFQRASIDIRGWTNSGYGYAVRMLRQMAAWLSLIGSGVFAGVVLLLAALLRIPAALIRRRRGQEALVVAPWGEGWLARTLLAVFVPVAVVITVMALTIRIDMTEMEPEMVQYAVGVGAIVLGQIVFLILILRRLHHSLDRHIGERTGILRFIFRAPAAAKAWSRKCVTAAMLGQLVFLGCCFALMVIVYRPVLGCHPWQMQRMKVGSQTTEQQFVGRIVAPMKNIDLTR